MAMGSNALSMRGSNRAAKENLQDAINEAKNKFWGHMGKIGWIYDDKAIRLEKDIETAEYNLSCYEYEDDRRRNWK